MIRCAIDRQAALRAAATLHSTRSSHHSATPDQRLAAAPPLSANIPDGLGAGGSIVFSFDYSELHLKSIHYAQVPMRSAHAFDACSTRTILMRYVCLKVITISGHILDMLIIFPRRLDCNVLLSDRFVVSI
jgi:hypothetical protein